MTDFIEGWQAALTALENELMAFEPELENVTASDIMLDIKLSLRQLRERTS